MQIFSIIRCLKKQEDRYSRMRLSFCKRIAINCRQSTALSCSFTFDNARRERRSNEATGSVERCWLFCQQCKCSVRKPPARWERKRVCVSKAQFCVHIHWLGFTFVGWWDARFHCGHFDLIHLSYLSLERMRKNERGERSVKVEFAILGSLHLPRFCFNHEF
jgi:hypothetical protein